MAAPTERMLFSPTVSMSVKYSFCRLTCPATPFSRIVRGIKGLASNPGSYHQSQKSPSEPAEDRNENKTDSEKPHSFPFKYEKARVDDKRIGRLMMLVKSRKYREQTDRVLLEGRRLITDAIECGLQPHTIFFSRLENLKNIPVHKTRASLVKVPFKDITLWSDVATTQGILGVFKKPSHEHFLRSGSPALPLTLICDNIREPGNLGTILRSAVAAQCEKILLTKGCVDLWEPKVLRAGAGAHFHMPILSNIPWPSVPNHLDDDTAVHVADNRVSRASPQDSSSDWPEAFPYRRRGTREEHRAKQEQAGPSLERGDCQPEDGDSRALPMLESKSYYEVDWRVKSAIVIGGETEGLSDSALELCDKSLGFRVHIPMARTMESLNSAVSASVILFEVLRQNSVHRETGN